MKDLVNSLIRGAINGDIIGTEIEEPNESAKTFYKLLTEAKRELYPGFKEATKVSFIVRLFQIKCMFVLVILHYRLLFGCSRLCSLKVIVFQTL